MFYKSPAPVDPYTTVTVAVIYKGNIHMADFPVRHHVLNGFVKAGDESLVEAAKVFLGIPACADTVSLVWAEYLYDEESGQLRKAKATREQFIRRVKEEARHRMIIHQLMEEVA